MLALSDILAWKYNNAPGIRTKENEKTGKMEIFNWPASLGSEPTLQQVESWRAEATVAIADQEKESEVEVRIIKALAAVMLSEINLLRAEHGLPIRTAVQLKAAIKARI